MSCESAGNVAVVRCKYSLPLFNFYMYTKSLEFRIKKDSIYYEFKEDLRR